MNPEPQERVAASARALGYSANVQAQAVARGTSNIVALVVGDIADPYFAAIASGVVRVADERGLIADHHRDRSARWRLIGRARARRDRRLRGQRPRAVVLAGSRVAGEEEPDLGRAPVAVIGSGAPGLRIIAVDNCGGAAALATELRGLRYTDAAVLAGPEELVTVRDRVEGFRSVIPAAPLTHAEFSRAGATARCPRSSPEAARRPASSRSVT